MSQQSQKLIDDLPASPRAPGQSFDEWLGSVKKDAPVPPTKGKNLFEEYGISPPHVLKLPDGTAIIVPGPIAPEQMQSCLQQIFPLHKGAFLIDDMGLVEDRPGRSAEKFFDETTPAKSGPAVQQVFMIGGVAITALLLLFLVWQAWKALWRSSAQWHVGKFGLLWGIDLLALGIVLWGRYRPGYKHSFGYAHPYIPFLEAGVWLAVSLPLIILTWHWLGGQQQHKEGAMKAIIVLGVVLGLCTEVSAACHYEWDCTDGYPCEQVPICDDALDMPGIPPLGLSPLPSPTIEPLPSLVLPPIGTQQCQSVYLCNGGRCGWQNVCQ